MMLLRKMKSATAAAVLLTAVSIASQDAAADHFRVIAEVGYMARNRIGGKVFKLEEEVPLKVPAQLDCFLTPKYAPGGKTAWECQATAGRRCEKPAIAIKEKLFPWLAELDYYRLKKPRTAAVSICPAANVSLKKWIGCPVYFTKTDAAEEDTSAVIRIKTGKILGRIKPDVRVAKPFVTLSFDKLERKCSCFGVCSTYSKTGETEDHKLPFDPIPTDDLPAVWQLTEDESGRRLEPLQLTRLTKEQVRRSGGLCVSALPYQFIPSRWSLDAILNPDTELGDDADAFDDYRRWPTGGSFPDVALTFVNDIKKLPLTCAAFIIPSKSKSLVRRLTGPPRFFFDDEALQVQRMGKRIRTQHA